MTPRINRWMVILLLALAIPWYWLFIENSPGSAQPKPVTMTQLRKLAGEIDGELPERIRYETVGSCERMSNHVAAGTGMRVIRLSTFSYMIKFERDRAILVGSGVAPGDADELEIRSYSPRAQARINAALRQSRAFIPLDPGPLQMGGINRDETYAWLLTLRNLKEQAPRLLIVSGGMFPRGSGIERYFPATGRE